MRNNLVALCLLFVAGCGPLVVAPPGPNNPVKPSPTKCETVWCEMADMVDAGVIADTDKLILIVDRLRDGKDIDDMGRVRFYDAFPDIRATRRPVTQADAETLRGLK